MKIAMKKALVVPLLVVGVTWAVGASAEVDTLKIGVVSALTGPGSEWGLAQDGAAKIVAMEVNAKGGLKVGNKTYKVEVISYDDQYKAALAVTDVTRLIEQDKVNFVVGPMGSASLIAVKSLYEKNKILAIIGAYTEKALDADTKYIFRGFPTQEEFARPFVVWLKENKPDLKTVAELEPNDETGWASHKVLSDRYESAGYKFVASELFERSLKDFQPLLTRILAAKPDIIELGTTPPSITGLLIRQARELGFQGQFVKIGGGVDGPQIVAIAGKENVEGFIVAASADTTTPNYKNLAEQYAKVLKPPMNEFTVYFYDDVHIMFDAIQQAGTVEDTDKVRLAMEKLTPYSGLQGTIRWGGMKAYGCNHQILTPTFIGVFKDGKEEIVGRME
jgi:branched-chain amino acid transport system substrate-binding protein